MSGRKYVNRRVSLGAVSERLCRPKHRSRNPLPGIALAVTTMAVGLIVHASLDQFRSRHNDNLLQEPHLKSDETEGSSQRRLAPKHSQVRSVIELLGAFEQIERLPNSVVNPADLADELPTDRVTFYTGESKTPVEDSAKFLEEIHVRSPDIGQDLHMVERVVDANGVFGSRPTAQKAELMELSATEPTQSAPETEPSPPRRETLRAG